MFLSLSHCRPTHIDQSDAEFTLVFFVDEGNNITTPLDSSFGAGNFVDTDLKVVVKPARGTVLAFRPDHRHGTTHLSSGGSSRYYWFTHAFGIEG